MEWFGTIKADRSGGIKRIAIVQSDAPAPGHHGHGLGAIGANRLDDLQRFEAGC